MKQKQRKRRNNNKIEEEEKKKSTVGGVKNSRTGTAKSLKFTVNSFRCYVNLNDLAWPNHGEGASSFSLAHTCTHTHVVGPNDKAQPVEFRRASVTRLSSFLTFVAVMLPVTTSWASGKKPPLPPRTIPVQPRIPRKHTIRLRKELGAFVLILSVLAYLLRILRQHNAANHHQSFTPWQNVITPRYTLDDLREIPRNLLYLTKENVQFCYIPKNACSALKPLLRKREGFSDWADPHMIHGKKNGLQRVQWLSREDAMERLNDTHAYRFVVVRNPFSRLISAWQNKVAAPWPDQRADFWNQHLRRECPSIVDATTMPRDGPLMSLEQFLKCLNSEDTILPSNEHWRPQTELCGLDHVRYSRYVYLENFAPGVADVLKELQWNEDPAKFKIHRKAVYERPLASFFNQQTVDLTLQYYKLDFDILGYDLLPSGTIGFYSVFNGTNFHPDFVPPEPAPPPAHS